jgi:hypothetical protein
MKLFDPAQKSAALKSDHVPGSEISSALLNVRENRDDQLGKIGVVGFDA